MDVKVGNKVYLVTFHPPPDEKKRQVNNLNYSVFNEVKYINQLFGIIL